MESKISCNCADGCVANGESSLAEANLEGIEKNASEDQEKDEAIDDELWCIDDDASFETKADLTEEEKQKRRKKSEEEWTEIRAGCPNKVDFKHVSLLRRLQGEAMEMTLEDAVALGSDLTLLLGKHDEFELCYKVAYRLYQDFQVDHEILSLLLGHLAGHEMLRDLPCALCLRQRAFNNSHVYPEWLFIQLTRTPSGGRAEWNVWDLEQGSYVTPRNNTMHLLCNSKDGKGCEGIFAKYEGNFERACADRLRFSSMPDRWTWTGSDVYHFGLSMIWRIAALNVHCWFDAAPSRCVFQQMRQCLLNETNDVPLYVLCLDPLIGYILHMAEYDTRLCLYVNQSLFLPSHVVAQYQDWFFAITGPFVWIVPCTQAANTDFQAQFTAVVPSETSITVPISLKPPLWVFQAIARVHLGTMNLIARLSLQSRIRVSCIGELPNQNDLKVTQFQTWRCLAFRISKRFADKFKGSSVQWAVALDWMGAAKLTCKLEGTPRCEHCTLNHVSLPEGLDSLNSLNEECYLAQVHFFLSFVLQEGQSKPH